MTLLGNIIWIVFGGFFVFLGYLMGGLAPVSYTHLTLPTIYSV